MCTLVCMFYDLLVSKAFWLDFYFSVQKGDSKLLVN